MAAPPERRWPSAEEAVAHPAAMRWHSPEFEGIQQLSMTPAAVGPLRQRMLERNGLHPELHDPSFPGFAQRAAAAFHRDGFCPPSPLTPPQPHPHPPWLTDARPTRPSLAGVVQNVLPAPDLAALRAKALAQMEEVLAMDRWGGGKGAWTYMFGVQNDRTSMMCAGPQPPVPACRNVW